MDKRNPKTPDPIMDLYRILLLDPKTKKLKVKRWKKTFHANSTNIQNRL